jgi:hypothetical protein
LTPKIPIRCNKAQNSIISGNWIWHKIKDFQQSFPEASHSPQIVPRGTIGNPPPNAAGAAAQTANPASARLFQTF